MFCKINKSGTVAGNMMEIQEPEAGDANLEEEMTELILYGAGSGITNDCEPKMGNSNRMSDSHPTRRTILSSPTRKGGRGGQDGTPVACLSSFSQRDDSTPDPPSALVQCLNYTSKQYLNILQSMGQSLVILDQNGLIAFWSPFSEHLYGYSASEMLGRSPLGPIVEECDFTEANEIIHRSTSGECWTGQFPVRSKQGRRFQTISTITPFYDDIGTLVGVMCLDSDSQSFLEISPFSAGIILSPEAAYPSYIKPATKIGLTTTAPQEKPRKVVIASNLLDLTSRMIKKVRAKMTTLPHRDTIETVGSDNREDSQEEISRGKQYGISKMITSIVSVVKGISEPWKGSEQNGSLTRTTSHHVSFSLNHEPEVDIVQPKSSVDSQSQAVEHS